MRVEPVMGKVLLRTSDAEARQLWADALHRHGLRVVVASGNRLLRRWEKEGIDLAVVDAHDHQAGLKLCKRLRAGTFNPILLLAAECDEGT